MQPVVGHSISYELSNGFREAVWELIVLRWCGYHPFWNEAAHGLKAQLIVFHDLLVCVLIDSTCIWGAHTS